MYSPSRRQTCRVCGAPDKFDFKVADDVWKRAVPGRYANGVVCLGCFDDLARETGVDYSHSIEELYFAGDQACFRFSREWSSQT